MQSVKKIQYILFDLDGTLINTNDLIMESFRHTFRTHNLEISDDEIRRHFSMPLRDQFQIFAPDHVEELVETYRRFNWDMHDELTTEFAGTTELLEQLVERGYQLAIVTSKIRPVVEKGLRLFNLTRFFPVLVCAEDTDKHKPDPAPVALALDLLKADSGQTIMIGDSPFDILAGKAAGTKAFAVAWSSFPVESLQACDPDLILQKPTDLLNLLK